MIEFSEGNPGAPRRRRGWLLQCAAGLAIAVALNAGIALAQPAGERAAPVMVGEVLQAPAVVEVPLTGSVVARRVADVSTQVDGYVDAVEVEIGDRVVANQPLLRLDARLARAALRAAQGRLAQARSRLADAERRRDEAATLLEEDNVPATQFASLEAEVAQERAGLEALAADVERLRTTLDQHVIRAPFDGVVAERRAQRGEWLTRGAGVVVLNELAVVRVRIDAPQALWPRVGVGTPADLRFDAYAGEPRRAAVSIKVAATDPAARTFPMLFDLDNRDAALTPGMSVRVGLQVTEAAGGETLQLPRDAVVRGPDGVTRVWVLRPAPDTGNDPVVKPVTVALGRSFGPRVEVIDGSLEAGDRVVVRGNETLRAGQRVRVMSDPAGSS